MRFQNCANYNVKQVKISSYLDAEVSKDQQELLNPSVHDSIVGFIIKDSKGEGARKRLPQRRLNMMDGGISSYCCVLNSEERRFLMK